MFRFRPGSRLALKQRYLRGRFGITAPQVAVRPHIPRYQRLLVIGVSVLLLVLLARFIYDTGRKVAGFDGGETAQMLEELRTENHAYQEEVARLRSLLSSSESNVQIERSAQKLLTEQNSALVAENARLKEENAVFDRFVRVEPTREGNVSLDKLNVRPGSPGIFNFGFMIALQGSRRGKEATFDLQMIVSPEGAGANITLPRGKDDPDLAQYQITLKNFRRIEGSFKVPDGFKPAKIEFNILESGNVLTSKTVGL